MKSTKIRNSRKCKHAKNTNNTKWTPVILSDVAVKDICSQVEIEATSTYIASPNFPDNYPPNLDCSCVVSAVGSRDEVRVRLEVVYLAVKYTNPCKDWLKIGRRRTCGTSVDLYRWTIRPAPPPLIYKRVHLFIAKETNWLSQADTYYTGTSLPLFCQVILFKFSTTWGCVSLPRSTTTSGWKLLTFV